MINKNRNKIWYKLREASRVTIEHIFKNYEYFRKALLLYTIESSEGKEYNEKYNELHSKSNYNQICNLLNKNIFPFRTGKYLKESPHMFDTKNNK